MLHREEALFSLQQRLKKVDKRDFPVKRSVAQSDGGLAGLLETLEPSGVNIEYMYAFTFGREGRARRPETAPRSFVPGTRSWSQRPRR